jgi:hypothetical protein
VPAVALAVGLLIGVGTGAVVAVSASDPTQSEQYLALQGDLRAADDQASRLASSAREAEEARHKAQTEVAQRQAELDQRERELAEREKAVTATEQQIAANSIGQGTWTVGRDIEPGTYRTREAVTRQCYWGIFRSGSNGSDIVDNDIVDGGFPTVTLREGQDFENNNCGTFIKQ